MGETEAKQSGRSGKDRYSIRAVDRAIDLLMAFAGEQREFTLSELASAVNLEKPTVHRLVRTLESRRMIDRAPSGRYTLGRSLATLGMTVVENWSLPDVLAPTLRRLVDETGETALCSVLDGSDVLTLASREGQHRVRMSAVAGEVAPAAITADGKVLLSALDRKAALRRVAVSRPEYPGQDRRWLSRWLAELTEVRKNGFAVDRGSHIDGLHVVSVPVRDLRGVVCAAVAVAGPSSRLDSKTLDDIVTTLKQAVPSEISYEQCLNPPFVN